MSANVENVDVVLDTEGFDVPQCPHGPALLFTRYDRKGKEPGGQRQFFACSAFRDRKQCRFFQYADVKVSKANYEKQPVDSSFSPKHTHEEFWKRFQRVTSPGVEDDDRMFCDNCQLLLVAGEEADHGGHKVRGDLPLSTLLHPSTLLQPLDDNKTYSQYLFSPSTVALTVENLLKLGVTHVLCVGAPRIHEGIVDQENSNKRKLTSLLMDLDHRYMQMLPPEQFCHFNMFNFHFFDSKKGEKTYRDFVSPKPGKKVAIVTDPPFGGMVEVLAASLKQMLADCSAQDLKNGAKTPVLWFFPYFMEHRITQAMPLLHMIDYKVDYDNHSLFSVKKKGKKGSPVRIFTNLDPPNFPLPAHQGYRWCKKCSQYSSLENKHCDKCGKCTSKDGSSYVHCGRCGRCVKPSWVHCDTCGGCQLQDHRCGAPARTGCHICGELGHKRRECPQKDSQSRKRPLEKKLSSTPGLPSKKQRKKNGKAKS